MQEVLVADWVISLIFLEGLITITSAKVVMFVCLSAGLHKNKQADETWCREVARVEEDPINIWSGTRSRGESRIFFFIVFNIVRGHF